MRRPGIANSTGPLPNWALRRCTRATARESACNCSSTRTTGRRRASTPAAMEEAPRSARAAAAGRPVRVCRSSFTTGAGTRPIPLQTARGAGCLALLAERRDGGLGPFPPLRGAGLACSASLVRPAASALTACCSNCSARSRNWSALACASGSVRRSTRCRGPSSRRPSSGARTPAPARGGPCRRRPTWRRWRAAPPGPPRRWTGRWPRPRRGAPPWSRRWPRTPRRARR